MTTNDLEGGVRRVDLAGRMDIVGVGRIETRFTASVGGHGGPVLVDLAGVDFLSSMGIRLLVANAKAAKARGGRVVLLRPQGPVAESLRDTGIDAVLPIAATEEEGLALLRA